MLPGHLNPVAAQSQIDPTVAPRRPLIKTLLEPRRPLSEAFEDRGRLNLKFPSIQGGGPATGRTRTQDLAEIRLTTPKLSGFELNWTFHDPALAHGPTRFMLAGPLLMVRAEASGSRKMSKTVVPSEAPVTDRSPAHRAANSPVIKRSIIRNGHKSSVSLEDQFWDGLREIADLKHMTVSALVATIDHGPNRRNLSSAIRVFVLDHFRNSSREAKLPVNGPHLDVPAIAGVHRAS